MPSRKSIIRAELKVARSLRPALRGEREEPGKRSVTLRTGECGCWELTDEAPISLAHFIYPPPALGGYEAFYGELSAATPELLWLHQVCLVTPWLIITRGGRGTCFNLRIKWLRVSAMIEVFVYLRCELESPPSSVWPWHSLAVWVVLCWKWYWNKNSQMLAS